MTNSTAVDYSPSIDSFIHNVGVFLILLAVLLFYVRRVQKGPPKETDQSFLASFSRWFVLGRQSKAVATKESTQSGKENFVKSAAVLATCAVGLQAAYLTWGVLQERLITLDYDGEKFKSSQFLVFTNRAIAFCVAIVINRFGATPTHFAPFYKFSFASFSNILSSWCQYEALKYVSFPTQVVSKSSKLIPVMIVGKILAKKKYQYYEYAVAAVISIGVIVFTLSQEVEGDDDDGQSTVVGGIVLCLGYICFDSFTSQWQGLVFKTYKVTPYQMMLGVNAFSASFTLISLLINAELLYCVQFVMTHPSCIGHILLLSVCGATGQCFIFYTIKRFGPLVFTIIMTTRQLISIILSCIIYSHPIAAQGYVGAAIVFGALLYKIKRNYDKSKKPPVAYMKVDQATVESEIESEVELATIADVDAEVDEIELGKDLVTKSATTATIK